jgi:hypothetical protein
MNHVYGLLGFFFFVSTPAILRLSHWAYIDLGITFYSTASILCLLRWREEREAWHWLMLAGLSSGFALATKPNGLVAGLLLSFIFLYVLASRPRKQLSGIITDLGLFAGLTLLPFLPWLAKNWLQTGNPFFPLLSGFFKAKPESISYAGSFVSLGIFEKRELLYGENIWQILGLPLRVFFFGQDDNPRYFDGVLTPVLILFLPWAFKGKWGGEKKILAFFAAGYFLMALFLVDLRIRYIILIVPPLVLLLAYGIFNMYLSMKRPMFLFITLVFFAGWHGTYLWQYLSGEATFSYLIGTETRENFLIKKLPEYPAIQYINRVVSPAAKIYLLFLGRRTYYCERDYFHDPGELPAFLLGAVQKAKDPQDIERTLKSKRITHFLAREDLLTRFLADNLTQTQKLMWNDFALRRLKLAFRERGYAVYSIDV